MAKNDAYLIANPTGAPITIGGVTVASGKVELVTIEDEAHAVYLVEWVCKGCTIAPASKTNASAQVTDVVDSETQLVEKGAFLLEALARAVQSAGENTFAQFGL